MKSKTNARREILLKKADALNKKVKMYRDSQLLRFTTKELTGVISRLTCQVKSK